MWQSTKMRHLALVASIAALVAFAWGIAIYDQVLAGATMVIAVPLLSMAAHRRLLVAPTFVALLGVTFWAAFGTTTGYFWLNRGRLEALVAEIEAVPAITSLELGVDSAQSRRTGGANRYDSYRFINGQLVTQYRE